MWQNHQFEKMAVAAHREVIGPRALVLPSLCSALVFVALSALLPSVEG